MDYLQTMGIQRWKQRAGIVLDKTTVDRPDEIVVDGTTTEKAISENTASVLPYQDYDWQALAGCLVDGSVCISCQQSGHVFGSGDLTADWLFVSDAPNSKELAQQLLFAGRSGQLFDAILSAIGLQRDSVYITSVFKCPPSGDGAIMEATCSDILQRQVTLLQPKVIVSLGEFAAQCLLNSNDSLSVLRTKQLIYTDTEIPVISTVHPRQLLDDPTLKALVWDDLKRAYEAI